MSSVYIKKDVYSTVRKAVAGLRNREKEEREKAENTGENITCDWKNYVLSRNGVSSFNSRYKH